MLRLGGGQRPIRCSSSSLWVSTRQMPFPFKSQLQSHLLGEGVPVQTCLLGLTVPCSYFSDRAYPVLGLNKNNKLYPCPLILELTEKYTRVKEMQLFTCWMKLVGDSKEPAAKGDPNVPHTPHTHPLASLTVYSARLSHRRTLDLPPQSINLNLSSDTYELCVMGT